MKKILFVNSSLSGGGSEKVMTILANGFSDRNYSVDMVLVREGKNNTYNLSNKVNCIKLKYKKKNKINIFISRINQLRMLIKKNDYDYVISFMYDINFVTILACLGLNKKVIVSERADPKNRTKFRKLTRIVELLLYRFASKIVFQTNYVRKLYPKYIQKKSTVIVNPVDSNIPERFNGIRDKIIVAAGRFTNQKNFEMLINCFEIFHKKNKDFKLIIYGEGSLRKNYEQLIDKYNAKDYILLPGFKDNVNELMNKSFAYVSTSNYEGISNSMLEALAMGLPSICTDCPVGGAGAIIKNDENGILIPLGDEDKLIESLNLLVNDEEYYKKLSENAVKTKTIYSIDNIVSIWEKEIE